MSKIVFAKIIELDNCQVVVMMKHNSASKMEEITLQFAVEHAFLTVTLDFDNKKDQLDGFQKIDVAFAKETVDKILSQ